MDKFCPIYHFDHHEEDHLGYENTISTFEIQQQQQQYIIQENLMTTHALSSSFDDMGSFLNHNLVGHGGGDFHHQTTFVDNNFGMNMRQHRSAASASGNNVDFDNSDDIKQKKMLHKEIERQRRHQMANLYASLKSVLPLESSKGRKSTSDLIHEAENHIRLKQKNIEELRVQRDNMKKWSNDTKDNTLNNSSSSLFPCSYPVDISVRSHLGGMEILISIDMRMDGFQLSRVLEVVIAGGLCVVSCVCTRIKGKILHTIQTEVSHLEVTDAYDLKQKLFDIVNKVPNLKQLQD